MFEAVVGLQVGRPVCSKSAVCLSYCEQVSAVEYEQQRHDVAHDALLQLLDDIIHNDDMTPTTKQRRLTQVYSNSVRI